jgi:hypothetical protein
MATYFLLRLDLSTRNNEFFFVLSEFPCAALLWAVSRGSSGRSKGMLQSI